MSGDWIKMRVDLLTHPKVIRMASALKADRFRVIGGMLAVWAVFDTHSADGHMEGYTLQIMDETIGWRGFSAAMASIGWLNADDEGLSAPEFETHNSKSAKRRALDSSRKMSGREADKTANGSWNSDGQMSASDADKTRTREELEKKKKKPPTPLPPGFEKFWEAYPRKTAKADAVKAWEKIEPDDSLQGAILKAVARQTTWPQWAKDEGEYVPYPASWLNGRRWEDQPTVNGAGPDDIFAGAH